MMLFRQVTLSTILLLNSMLPTRGLIAGNAPLAATRLLWLSSSQQATGSPPIRYFLQDQNTACSTKIQLQKYRSNLPEFSTGTCLSMVRRNYRGNGGGGRGSSSNNSTNNNNQRRRGTRRPQSPPPPMPAPGSPGRGCFKELIVPDLEVWVVQKEHQRSGEETRGVVDRLLTKSPYHPRGIKVMLASGQVGRVTRIVDDS